MRQLLLSILLCLSGLAQAQSQVNLTGRIYKNDNILADELNKAMAVVDQKMDSVRQAKVVELEKKKGRKLNATEKAEIDKQLAEAQKAMAAIKKGMSTRIEVEFKDARNMVMTMKMSVDDNALKLAGVPWVKRKAMKAALAIAPSSQKCTYRQQGNLIIVEDEEESDTLRLSSDGKYIYGKMDKKTSFKLTRLK